MVKNPSANAEDTRSIPGWGRSSGEGNGNLEMGMETPLSLLGKCYG